jgi:hypothetical protein
MIFDRSGGVWAFPPPSPGLPLPPHGPSGPGRHPTTRAGRVEQNPASGVGARGVSTPALPAAQVTVAALYVDPNGVYAGLPDVDLWDEARDARLYDGPYPVVAHPPCQRWCRFAKGIARQYPDKQVGDDGGCFAAALKAVRRFGGVLEHPAESLAWAHFGLPYPRSTVGWTTAFLDDGASCYVEQGRYGHPMRKATWLYAYGVELPQLNWGRQLDSQRGEFKWGSRLYKPAHDRDRPRVDKLHSVTPEAFRDVLLEMARTAAQVPCA